ncbi:MAG: macrolide ABC transporter permease [Azospira oryzae]|jgi:putative ABC transport system permease protein|nr:MAG: macrolide ABC transporter permease [Azospira oryzae]
MIKKIIGSFLLAFQNIRSRFFHTLLSVLGIVIGVAALVAILSLIDGMELFAKEQIATTTSLNGVVIHSSTSKMVNEVNVRKDTFAVINYHHFLEAKQAITKPVTFYLLAHSADQVKFGDSLKTVGARITATGMAIAPRVKQPVSGRLFTEQDLMNKDSIALVNRPFLKAVKLDSSAILNQTVVVNGRRLRIAGVYQGTDEKNPHLVVPITLYSPQELNGNPPEMVIDVASTLDVNTVKDEIDHWLKKKFPKDEFNVFTNQVRLKQAEQGFLLFRVIMGMIVGISVLVGGIGVMNVLLISVTQRTAEIGVRKAVGANRKDIIYLFLAESITVSAFGSFLGLVLGILGTMAFVPIIKALTKVPFQAAYTLDTLLIISLIAVLIGIVFGTYPALRASRLDPVEAIRRES